MRRAPPTVLIGALVLFVLANLVLVLTTDYGLFVAARALAGAMQGLFIAAGFTAGISVVPPGAHGSGDLGGHLRCRGIRRAGRAAQAAGTTVQSLERGLAVIRAFSAARPH